MKKIIFFFVGLQLSFAQKIIHYTTDDGLPHDITYNIHQDLNGYLWFGTDDGLVRYDGKSFKTFNEKNGLNNSYVIDIKQYNRDTLVIATWGGGLNFVANDSIFSISNEKKLKVNELVVAKQNIYSYRASNTLLWKKNTKKIYAVAIDFNNKFLVSEDDLHYLKSPRVTFLDNRTFFHKRFIKRGKNDMIKGVLELKNQKLVNAFPELSTKEIVTLNKYKQNFIAATQDSLFVFSEKEMLLRKKLQLNNKTVLKTLTLSNNNVLLIAADKNGFKDAFIYNLSSESLFNFRKEYSIKSTIADAAIDFEGNIWLTTNGEGIYQIPNYDYDITTITKDESADKLIMFNGSVFAINPNYLFQFSKNTLQKKYRLKGFGKNLAKHKNKLIISSYIQEEKQKITNSIFEQKGVFYYAKNNFSIQAKDTILINKKQNLTIPNAITSVCNFKNKFIVGTRVGVFTYDKLTKKAKKLNIDKLDKKNITDITFYNDFLWFATNQGIYKLKDSVINKITIKDGLIGNNVNDLLVTSDNKLWIATSKGVSVYDGKTFVNLTKNQNLVSNNINSLVEDSNANIWIATVRGISLLKNKEQIVNQPKPFINVTQNNSSFTFDVISYNSSNTLFTQYQINKQPWITTQSNTLDFKNFKEGKYQFKIRSKKPNSDWQYSDSYQFSIVIPFYKKPVFVAFLLIGAALLFIVYISYRLRRTKRTNLLLQESIENRIQLEKKLTSVRENIAQDFHDDLGNKLASITVLTDILSKKVESNDASYIVQQIQNNSDTLYKGTKDFIWSLKSDSDELEELITYLSDFGEEFFHQLQIDFRIEKNIQKNIKLPYYWSRHLILLFKEAMTNAAKHSGCKECILIFNFEDSSLKIALKDNGYGIHTTTKKLHNGILNMKKRAEKMNGELKITSTKNGTEILFIGNPTHLR